MQRHTLHRGREASRGQTFAEAMDAGCQQRAGRLHTRAGNQQQSMAARPSHQEGGHDLQVEAQGHMLAQPLRRGPWSAVDHNLRIGRTGSRCRQV